MAKSQTLLGLALIALMASAACVKAEGLMPAGAVKDPAGVSAVDNLLPARGTFKEVAREPAPALIPFEQPASAFRLSGEDDTGRFTFALSAAQAAAGGTLAIAYRNAVSVLPDTSTLDISVNGSKVSTVPVASPIGFLQEKLKLSAALLKEGRNEVRIRARQQHRVDCSLDATYELWTEFDPEMTGFETVRPATFRDFGDLASVGRNEDGKTEIKLVVPQPVTAEALNEAAPVLQTLTLFLNREDIVVSVADRPGEGAGIDLLVLTDKTGSRLASLAGAAPHGLSVRKGADAQRAMVILRAGSASEITRQLLAAIRGPLDKGLQTGIFAAKTGRLFAEENTSYLLSETGYTTEIFQGRLSRTAFDLVMPADFYPAEYATVDLYLKAATSPGLKQTSQFLVRVNDRVVKSYPFRNRDGEEFDGKRIELPMRAFRPGSNRVEFLAEVPVEADDACTPGARYEGKPRFLLLDNSEIHVPRLARIGRLPDLAAFSGRAYPYANGNVFDLFVEHPDNASLGAALTVLSRLALAARNPLDANIVFSQADPAPGRDALIVSAERSVAAVEKGGRNALWSDDGDGDAGTAMALAADPITTAGIGGLSIAPHARETSAADEDPDALLRAFQKSTAGSSDALSFNTRLRKWLSSASNRFGNWLAFGRPSEPVSRGSGQSLLNVTQQASPDGKSTWTVIQANSTRDLAVGTSRLIDAPLWNALTGGSAGIGADGVSLTSEPARSQYIAGLPDRSIGNIRRVAAAWLSENFQFYVLAILVLMGGFALWLGRVVPRKGVRTDR